MAKTGHIARSAACSNTWRIAASPLLRTRAPESACRRTAGAPSARHAEGAPSAQRSRPERPRTFAARTFGSSGRAATVLQSRRRIPRGRPGAGYGRNRNHASFNRDALATREPSIHGPRTVGERFHLCVDMGRDGLVRGAYAAPPARRSPLTLHHRCLRTQDRGLARLDLDDHQLRARCVEPGHLSTISGRRRRVRPRPSGLYRWRHDGQLSNAWRRGGSLHHSDRGSRSQAHLSIRYTERLADAGLGTSVGRVGDSYDCEYGIAA